MGPDVVYATLVLGGMCLLMWWLARLAKKRMGVGSGTVSGDGLRVVGKRPLDPKNALYVVEIAGGRHILVGASAEGGGISKVDDISAEEFAAMTSSDDSAAKPKLRIARATKDERASTGAPHELDDGTGAVDDDAAAEQRFATVGESFQHLLGKARDARRSRRASGDE